MNQGKILLELQEYLQKKEQIKKDTKLVNLVSNLRELKTTINKAEQENNELMAIAQNNEETAKDLVQEISKKSEQLKGGKERLYNAKGSGLKELLSLQQSIQKLEDEISDCETRYLKLLNEAEECRKTRIANKEIIKGLKIQFNSSVREYNEVRRSIELQLAEILCREEEATNQLSQAYLIAYQQAKTRFPLNPVAKIKGDACSSCHLAISSLLIKEVKAGQNVCFCENCGRILVK